MKEHSTGQPEGGSNNILSYPIELHFARETLRSKLNIRNDTFVIGCAGNTVDETHAPISLLAYKEIENEATLFLALSPPPRMIALARELGLKNFRCLETSADDVFLSRFYNTLMSLLIRDATAKRSAPS